MKENRKRIREITIIALCTSLALLLSYVEMLIPVLIQGIPGIKMGLPNIAIVFALYHLGAKKAAIISFMRVIIVSILFGGNITYFWYSIAGAALSLLVMVVLKKIDSFSTVGVSVAGALAHNVGQILVAMLLMQTAQIGYYLIVLSITGTVSGVFVGLCGAFVIKRINKIKI